MDISGVLEDIKDAREWPTRLPNILELKCKHLNQRCWKNSPARPQEEPDDLGGEAVTSGGIQSHLEYTRTEENKHVVEMNTLH